MATTEASLELFLKRLLKRKYESACQVPRKATKNKMRRPLIVMHFQGRLSAITEFLRTSVLLLMLRLDILLVFTHCLSLTHAQTSQASLL
jgi:hypothetical protein